LWLIILICSIQYIEEIEENVLHMN
jgi:hypothetical protein